jgi:hypothetical protein
MQTVSEHLLKTIPCRLHLIKLSSSISSGYCFCFCLTLTHCVKSFLTNSKQDWRSKISTSAANDLVWLGGAC